MKTTMAARAAIAALLAGAALAPQATRAQSSYSVQGSDTLFEIMTDGIAQWQAETSPANALKYVGGGSGKAESAMTAVPPTQSIGAMSRNFKAAVLTAHPNFTPGAPNVLGLDAGVIVVNNSGAPGYSYCPNLTLPLDPADIHAADYNNDLALVLSGKDGLGTTAACQDQARLDALARITACFGGVERIEHFYRRDDSSGTTDTFKEKLKIKRFCNGTATGTPNGNLSNQDQDPIRRACVPADSTHAATACTLPDRTTLCTAGTTDCTQGLVVALTQTDPGSADITLSLAHRVANDVTAVGNKYVVSMGYAGRTAVCLQRKADGSCGGPTAPVRINNVDPNGGDDLIRYQAYLLSRRLFLMKGDPTLDAARNAAEASFFDWATAELPADPAALPGRCNMDPIVAARGFVTCTDDCWTPPAEPNHLCSALPFPPAP